MLCLFGVLVLFLVSCFSRENGEENVQRTYRIGINSNVKATPVLVAEEEGYFRKAGISVESFTEPSALHLLEGLYTEAYDFVCVPSFLVARDYVAGESFRILAVLNRNQSRYVLMNPDHVENPSDFPGKTIGINPNSAAEFTLRRFLLLYGVDPASVSIRYYGEETLPEMLASGKVSAILTWPPYVDEARMLMNGNILVTNAQMGVDMYWLLVTREDISLNERESITHLLQGLNDGYELIFRHPDEAKKIVSNRLSVSSELINEEWRDFSFMLELPQSVLLVMEQQCAWIADRQDVEFNATGLFSAIADQHLEAIYPERVSIIR